MSRGGGRVIGARRPAPVTLINPKAGTSELAHNLDDWDPELVPARRAPTCPTPSRVRPRRRRPRGEGRCDSRRAGRRRSGDVVHTSGTTGPPKGAVLPRRAIASNLDVLAEAGSGPVRTWSRRSPAVPRPRSDPRHARAGPARCGVHASAGPRPRARRRRSAEDATMLFAVPTMDHRVAADAEQDLGMPRARQRAPARVRLGGAAGGRARADRAPHRPADRRARRRPRC